VAPAIPPGAVVVELGSTGPERLAGLVAAGAAAGHGIVFAGPANGAAPGVTLHSGEPGRIPALEGIRFDAAIAVDAFQALQPTQLQRALAWLYDHLAPGAPFSVDTRTWFHADGAGLAATMRTPLAHLLFPPAEIDRHLVARGLPPAPYANPSSATTYLIALRRAGFELRSVRRHDAGVDPAVYERFAGKLGVYDPEELRTGRIEVDLVRPADVPLDLPLGDVVLR
jgi:hypothetical protein